MKKIFLVIFLIAGAHAWARTQTIKGRIVDADKQNGIAYTNLGIEGTYFGTASDADGFFELKIPNEYADGKLLVSAVGYRNVILSIKEISGKDFVRIPLSEETYTIGGIDVAAQSRVLFRIIRTAGQKVPENYLAGPLGMKLYYHEQNKVNDSIREDREAVVDLYDETGYSAPSEENAYSSRNYRFIQAKRNFDPVSFPGGQTGFDELLNMDLARLSNTLFNEELLNDYDLHLEGSTVYDGDSVWVISYKISKPDLAHSGDYYATKMNGKMYVLKKNYALIRNECVIEAGRNCSQDRSLYTKSSDEENVRYHFVCLYKNWDGRYGPGYIACDKTYTDPRGQQVSYSRKASVLDLQKSPAKITGRDYFEDTPYAESFWASFKRP